MTIPDDRINIVAQFTAKEGSEDSLLEAMRVLVPPTLAEKGCERFELNQSRDEGRILTLVERFTDQAAYDAHAEASYTRHFLDNQVPDLVEERSVVFYHQIL